MRLSNLLLLTLLCGACANLQSGRSFLTEMGQDDRSFFEPGDDFPVLAGDSGRTWRNRRELLSRTPASEEDLAERRGRRSLKEELRQLEGSQSEGAFSQYEKYQHRFSNISERIYYLRLSPAERESYLQSRGFVEPVAFKESRPVVTPHERLSANRFTDVSLGMSKDDVRYTWGRPSRVEVAGNPSNENERWLYNMNGAARYIYFESGRVEGWE